MDIKPLKVSVREVVTGYRDDSDREEGIYGYSGRLKERNNWQIKKESQACRWKH